MNKIKKLAVVLASAAVMVTGTAGAADAAFIGKPRTVPYYHCHLQTGLFGLEYFCHTAVK
jgi:hypothetical protein